MFDSWYNDDIKIDFSLSCPGSCLAAWIGVKGDLWKEVIKLARKKTITKDQILNAAYDLVATKGFSKFTARNIAAHMKCSTQPIYLEFKNMEDLKQSLFEKIKAHLRDDIFAREVIGNPLIDMNLNYISFASEERSLYRSLYLEGHSEDEELYYFIKDLFVQNMNRDDKLRLLSDATKESLFSAVWIVSTGVASLTSGGLIDLSDKEIVYLLNNVIDGVIKNEEHVTEIV